jgi:AAA domain
MSNVIAIPQPRRAEKRSVKLKIGLQGPSGSGKTEGALALARNLVPNGRVLVVDTENESASLYADRFEFDTIPLGPPYTSARYEACIELAVQEGYDVLILDSVSQQWDGEGGILRRKEELDRRPGSNSFTNWAMFTPEHNKFVESIKQAPIHIIATMRSKTEYVLQANDKGKQLPKKVGTAPIQRDGFEYEFSLVFDIQMDHRAVAIKDRTALFTDVPMDLRDPALADQLRNWLSNTSEVKEAPQPTLKAKPVNTAKPKPPATVKTQPAAVHVEPEQQALPGAEQGLSMIKSDDWHYDRNSDTLSCVVLDAVLRKGRKGEFVALKHNGKVRGKDVAFCFHAHLFDLLLHSKGQTAKFALKTDEFVNVEDVLEIGGQEYREGKPANDLGGLGITEREARAAVNQ